MLSGSYISQMLFFLFLDPKRSAAARYLPIPKLSVDELSWQRFDEEFLDKKPVLIQGVSHCPTDFTLASILDACSNSAQVPLFRNSPPRGLQPWAGMRHMQDTELDKVIRNMSEGKMPEPSYAFGFHIVRNCPWALDAMTMPAHLVNSFVTQFEGAWGQCDNLPSTQLYLNTGYFQTNLHIDADHNSFYTSMCEGEKKWRIVSNSDLRNHVEAFEPYLLRPGFEQDGKLALSTLVGRFETWSDQSPLESMSVPVYEGVQLPGEVLYIPAGAPHAAKALTDNSVMVATNDHSIQDLKILSSVCSPPTPPLNLLQTAVEQESACMRLEKSDHAVVRTNHQEFASGVPRKDMPFLDLYSCSSKKTRCEKFSDRDNPAWFFDYCSSKAASKPQRQAEL